ncbi:MAG: PD40 domain-containing protein [Gemmatimonadota bacterium]|nr:MAG: PD40 domain-containing protein [Gemmatimonadota bacterium]
MVNLNGRLAAVAALALAGLGLAGCDPPSTDDFPVLGGEYLGQTPPGDSAELFAPGIVATGMYTRDVAITPDRSEIYFGVMVGGHSVIVHTKRVGGRWTRPEVAPFSRDPEHLNLEPHISPDGRRFFFLSTRPRDGGPVPPDQIGAWVNQDIWVMDRAGDGWSEPYNLGPPVNTDDEEFFPSVTRDGTLYFTRNAMGSPESYIYRSRWIDGRYTEPERLGPNVNSTTSQYNAFVAPDESYLIVCTAGREDGLGGSDYYVVFRSPRDRWSAPINMGEAVNSRWAEFSPYVSPDGRYFFFMSTRRGGAAALPDSLTYDYLRGVYAGPQNGNADIYWIDAGFIEALRPPGAR